MRFALGCVSIVWVGMLAGCALSHRIGVDADVDTGPRTPASLCASTGGRWRDGPCCPTTCGRECPLRCVSSNCACGPDQIWDDTLGCIHSSTCE